MSDAKQKQKNNPFAEIKKSSEVLDRFAALLPRYVSSIKAPTSSREIDQNSIRLISLYKAALMVASRHFDDQYSLSLLNKEILEEEKKFMVSEDPELQRIIVNQVDTAIRLCVQGQENSGEGVIGLLAMAAKKKGELDEARRRRWELKSLSSLSNLNDQYFSADHLHGTGVEARQIPKRAISADLPIDSKRGKAKSDAEAERSRREAEETQQAVDQSLGLGLGFAEEEKKQIFHGALQAGSGAEGKNVENKSQPVMSSTILPSVSGSPKPAAGSAQSLLPLIQCLVWMPPSEQKPVEEEKQELSVEDEKENESNMASFWRTAKQALIVNIGSSVAPILVELPVPTAAELKSMTRLEDGDVPDLRETNRLFSEKLHYLILHNFFADSESLAQQHQQQYSAILKSIIQQLSVLRKDADELNVAAREWARAPGAVDFGLTNDPRCSHLMNYSGSKNLPTDEVNVGFNKAMDAFIRFKVLRVATLDEALNADNQQKYNNAKFWIIKRLASKDNPVSGADVADISASYFMPVTPPMERKALESKKLEPQKQLYLKSKRGDTTVMHIDYDARKGIIARRVTPAAITSDENFQFEIDPEKQRKQTINGIIVISEESEHAPPVGMFQVFGPGRPLSVANMQAGGWVAVPPGFIDRSSLRNHQIPQLAIDTIAVRHRFAAVHPNEFKAIVAGKNFPKNFAKTVGEFYGRLSPYEQLASRTYFQAALMKAWDELPLANRLLQSLFGRPVGLLAFFFLAVAVVVATVFPPVLPALPAVFWYLVAGGAGVFSGLTLGYDYATPQPRYDIDTAAKSGSAKIVPELGSGAPSPSLSPPTPLSQQSPHQEHDLFSLATTEASALQSQQSRVPSGTGYGEKSPTGTLKITQSQQGLAQPQPQSLLMPPPLPQVIMTSVSSDNVSVSGEQISPHEPSGHSSPHSDSSSPESTVRGLTVNIPAPTAHSTPVRQKEVKANNHLDALRPTPLQHTSVLQHSESPSSGSPQSGVSVVENKSGEHLAQESDDKQETRKPSNSLSAAQLSHEEPQPEAVIVGGPTT